MGEFVRVGSVDDFREGKGRVVDCDGTPVAVFLVDGTPRAILNACPHMGASLADGKVKEGRVTCHMHGWTFDLRNGACDHRSVPARIYEVKLEGNDVLLRAPAPEAPTTRPDKEWVAFDPDRHFKRKRS
jgi:nitrite reductase (NADH) small subunit